MTSNSPPLTLNWRHEPLRQQLESMLPGIDLEIRSQAPSTNSLLLDRLRHQFQTKSAETRPCLLVAEAQTAGRGRLGRAWHATPGASLTFSLALPVAASRWDGLSLALGVALADTIDPMATTPLRVGLKWPNDLWLVEGLHEAAMSGQSLPPFLMTRGRKLGGVLIETVSCGGQRWAVIGVGLNVQPLASADATGLQTACWSELDPHISVDVALSRLAPAVLRAVGQFESQGFSGFMDRFHERDLLCGQEVILSEGSYREGKALGVTANGALRVDFDGIIQRIHSAEVSVKLKSV